MENPLLNIRLKLFSDKNLMKVFNIGSSFNHNYFIYNFSNNVYELIKIFEGKSLFNNIMCNSEKSLILFGQNFLNNHKSNFLNLNFFKYFKDKLNISFMNNNVSNIISQDYNLENSINNFEDLTLAKEPFSKDIKREVIYAINIDSFFFSKKLIKLECVYQGHHNLRNKISKNFNMLLPSVTFLEKNNSFINFFGLVQKTKFILFPPKEARSDFKILYIVFKSINRKLRKILNLKLFKLSFFKYNFLSLNYFNFFFYSQKNNKNMSFLNNVKLSSFLTNIYKLNQIVRSSLILLSCFKDIKKKYSNFI
jgi:hypothetical protein